MSHIVQYRPVGQRSCVKLSASTAFTSAATKFQDWVLTLSKLSCLKAVHNSFNTYRRKTRDYEQKGSARIDAGLNLDLYKRKKAVSSKASFLHPKPKQLEFPPFHQCFLSNKTLVTQRILRATVQNEYRYSCCQITSIFQLMYGKIFHSNDSKNE